MQLNINQYQEKKTENILFFKIRGATKNRKMEKPNQSKQIEWFDLSF